jgi:hypothetical protein
MSTTELTWDERKAKYEADKAALVEAEAAVAAAVSALVIQAADVERQRCGIVLGERLIRIP